MLKPFRLIQVWPDSPQVSPLLTLHDTIEDARRHAYGPSIGYIYKDRLHLEPEGLALEMWQNGQQLEVAS